MCLPLIKQKHWLTLSLFWPLLASVASLLYFYTRLIVGFSGALIYQSKVSFITIKTTTTFFEQI